MADCMMFPDDWRDFLKDYSFVDSEEVYTNGSPLIPVFRVEQLIEHLMESQFHEQEPRVMTLEEAKHLTYGSPYIIETNLPKEEPRLMYALFSHLGLQGNFTFAFTDARGYLFDSDYGKRWRCWTSRPDNKRRTETPWQ